MGLGPVQCLDCAVLVQERAEELVANVRQVDTSLQEAIATIAKTQELASQAAAATDLQQLSQDVDQLKSSIPDRDEMEKAVKQIQDLQENGLSALDDVGKLKADTTGLQERVAQVEALSSGFEGLKDAVQQTRDDVASLQASMEESSKASEGFMERLGALEADIHGFGEVEAKVRMPHASGCYL